MSRGKRALRSGKPLLAVREFRQAITRFNDDVEHARAGIRRRRELSDLHYYLAMGLRKAGMKNSAFAELVRSVALCRSGPRRRKIRTAANGYGMARQETPELDDRHAFYGIQLSRYLRSKKSHRLGTRAEIDMVMELVEENWREIAASGTLASMSYEQRLSYFREIVIVFPFLSVPEMMKTDDLAIDFYHGRRVRRSDRCPCGSALPYRLCHGRPPGIDEVLSGKF